MFFTWSPAEVAEQLERRGFVLTELTPLPRATLAEQGGEGHEVLLSARKQIGERTVEVQLGRKGKARVLLARVSGPGFQGEGLFEAPLGLLAIALLTVLTFGAFLLILGFEVLTRRHVERILTFPLLRAPGAEQFQLRGRDPDAAAAAFPFERQQAFVRAEFEGTAVVRDGALLFECVLGGTYDAPRLLLDTLDALFPEGSHAEP